MASNAQEKSQYHHYVPRFMLRKWQVEYVPPAKHPSHGDPSSSGKRRKGMGKGRRWPLRRSPEEYINMYDVETDTLHVGMSLSKAYGVFDMYKNNHDPEDVYHVEKLFSKLESQAARVFKKLNDAITGPHWESSSVPLPRRDVNTLRKFLFLMSYRSDRHARRFLEEKFDKATRNEVETFRQKHNLKDIPSVWLFNLRNMLESEHWEIPTNERILKSDRDAYHTDLHARQLAFYVAPDDCEFILTDNGLGLWEGENLSSLSMMFHMMTSDGNPAHSTRYHTRTYPVSPKLLILLRSTTMSQQQVTLDERLPSPIEMRLPFGKTNPDNSYFKDFPRTAAVVDYKPPLSRKLWDCMPADGEIIDGKIIGSRVEDVLTFRMRMLTAEQSSRVNALRLENFPRFITFKSAQKLLSSIRFYETTKETQGAGPVTGTPAYTRTLYASLAHQLKYLLEHGVPPTPVARPAPVSASQNPSASTSSSFESDRSVPSLGMFLIEQLLMRSTTAGNSATARPTSADRSAEFKQTESITNPSRPQQRLSPSRTGEDSGESTQATSPMQNHLRRRPSAGSNAAASDQSISANALPTRHGSRKQLTNKPERDAPPKPRKARLRRQLYPTPASVEAGTRHLLERVVMEFSHAGPSKVAAQPMRSAGNTEAAKAAAVVRAPKTTPSAKVLEVDELHEVTDSDGTGGSTTGAQGWRDRQPRQKSRGPQEGRRLTRSRRATQPPDENVVSDSGHPSRECVPGGLSRSLEVDVGEDSSEEPNGSTSKRPRRKHLQDGSANDPVWELEAAASNTFSMGSVLTVFAGTGILVTLALKLIRR